jgi:hypothetical protein
MKKPYLTVTSIRRAVAFLEKRKAHATGTENHEWAAEYENAIRIIRGLCVFELDGKQPDNGAD